MDCSENYEAEKTTKRSCNAVSVNSVHMDVQFSNNKKYLKVMCGSEKNAEKFQNVLI